MERLDFSTSDPTRAGGGEIGDQFDGGQLTVSGFELSGGYEWTIGQLRAPINLDYTWTTKAQSDNAFESGFEPWGTVEVGDELPYIPEHQLRASAGLMHSAWCVNVAANYIGKLRTRAGQGAFERADSIDSHVVWDLVTAWNLPPKLATCFKVDNLLDETYVAARRPAGARPGLPPPAYLGPTYRL